MGAQIRMVPQLLPGGAMIMVPVFETPDFGSNAAAQDRVRAARGGGEKEGSPFADPSSLLADVDGPDAPSAALPPAADAVLLGMPRAAHPVSLPKTPQRATQAKLSREGASGRFTAGKVDGGLRMGQQGPDAALGYTGAPGQRKSVSLGGGDGSMRGAYATENVIERDASGAVQRGEASHVGLDENDLAAGWSDTNDGKTTSGSVRIGDQGVDIAASHGAVSGSFGGDDDELRFGLGVKTGAGNVSGSYTSYGRGHVDGGATEDAFLEDAIGGSRYASRKSGHAASLGGEVGGTLSVGGSIGTSDVATASFHAAGAADDFASHRALAARLEGVSDYHDVDLDALAAGEAYAFDRQRGDAMSASLGAGPLSASIGESGASSSRTTLARDATGALRVNVSTGSASTASAGASVGGLLEASHSDTSASGASASFTARGEAGENAVRGWQDTGLLPGADRVAAELAPREYARWQRAVTELQFLRMQSDGSVFSRHRIAEAQSTVRWLAEPLNQEFLNARDQGLGGTDVEGVTWDERTTMTQSHSGTEASLAGMSLGSEGVTDTFSDTFYREGGEEKKEAGFQREDDYWSSPTETSRVAVDPKGNVALRMFSEWEAWQQSHDSLAELGPDAFGLPPEVVEAWRSGAIDKGENTRLMLSLSEEELARLGDLIGDDGKDSADAWSRIDEDVYEMRDYMRSVDMTPQGRSDRERIRVLLDTAVRTGPDGVIRHFPASERETNALCDALAKVNTPAEFLALNDAEKRVVVGTAVVAAARRKSNPWEALRLVMSLPAGAERNDLLRELFVQIESNRRGSNAAIEFVQFVQAESKEAGQDSRDILGAVKVETADGARDLRAESAEESTPDDPVAASAKWATTLRNAVGERVRPAHRPDAPIVLEAVGETEGKEVADWMRIIVDRSGRRALEDAVRVAFTTSPRFFERLNQRLADDPHQRAIVRHLLRGTAFAEAVTEPA